MKKQYIRQQDNLLYEKLIYTGEFHQSSKFTFVVYDKKTYFVTLSIMYLNYHLLLINQVLNGLLLKV